MQRISLEHIADHHWKNGSPALGIGTTSPVREHRLQADHRPGGPHRLPWNSAPFHGRPLPKKGGWVAANREPASYDSQTETYNRWLAEKLQRDDSATDLPGIFWNTVPGGTQYPGGMSRPANQRFMEDCLSDKCLPQKPRPGVKPWDSSPYHAVSVAIGGRAIWEPVVERKRPRALKPPLDPEAVYTASRARVDRETIAPSNSWLLEA